MSRYCAFVLSGDFLAASITTVSLYISGHFCGLIAFLSSFSVKFNQKK
jgi:hypothetical protein